MKDYKGHKDSDLPHRGLDVLSFSSLLFLLSFSSLWAMPLTSPQLQTPPVTIQLDFAETLEKKSWGLMRRWSLPNDYGMLFAYTTPTKIDLWSFNCYTNMAVAFLDDRGVIQEITRLKAYPEMMDPLRPVNSLQDMRRYPSNDPIIRFYASHSVTSSRPCTYALETSPSFFQENQIRIADQLIWDETKSKGMFLRGLHSIPMGR